MKEHIIRLEPHDDVTTVREKLGWIQASHVLLVFPDDLQYPLLYRRLDLILLQREATRRRAQLALITRDPIVQESARELGIACFPSIGASRRTAWETARAQITVSRADQPTPLDPELAEAATRLRQTPEPVVTSLSPRVKLALSGLATIGLLVVLFLFVPGATIHLSPATNQVTVTTTVTADPTARDIASDAGVIPARVVGVEVEGQTTIATTGTTERPTEKARGAALFTNLVPDQVTIPAGTILRTSAAQPVRFVTLSDATLPGTVRATVEVPIEAINPGFEGNLPVGRINQVEGPLSSRLAVTNSQPTQGGDVTVLPAISEDDYTRIRALLLQQLQQRAYAAMQTDSLIALSDTEFVPLESLTVVLMHSEVYDGYVGQPAAEVNLDMRVTVQGLAVDERLARQIVYEQLAARVSEGFQLSPDSLVFRRGEVSQYDDQHRLTFVMQGAGDIAAIISPGDVRRLVRGRLISRAASILDDELPLAAPPLIQTWPSIWPLLPVIPQRMQVNVGGQP